MKVEITITGSVDKDPAQLVRDLLYIAVDQGLAGGRADFSAGRMEGLTVEPDPNQHRRMLAESVRAGNASPVKVALRKAQEAVREAEAAVRQELEELEEESKGEQASVLEVRFASAAAAKLADKLNLTTADFEPYFPSGKNGFIKRDVEDIAEEKAG